VEARSDLSWRRRPWPLFALALAAGAASWILAAHYLWASTVPSSLRLPHLLADHLFSRSYLRRSASYERFLYVDGLIAEATLLLVLGLYALRGHRLMRESAAGRIGTGILLGMLGFAIVWLAELPFGLAGVWWQRRHHVSHQGYAAWITQSFFSLGAQFLFVSLALLVAMGLAGVLRKWWWAVAAPVFVALALLSTFLSPYLIPDTTRLHDAQLASDARHLQMSEGVTHAKILVQNVSRYTTAPNAESVGLGSTRTVILWNTLLNGRFSRREIDVVIAHELGHLEHDHPLKRVGWLALFLVPASALIALFTRRRGGLARPEAVPVALLVLVVLQLLTAPLLNVVSRREEAEADWSALRATRDPVAARELFQDLATTSLADPDPPTWSYVLLDGHPTIVQRIAMVDAWEARARRG
jgi:STE24 endopeptidase